MKLREWISIQVSKKPGRLVLLMILIFNVVFVMFSAVIINSFQLRGTEGLNFLESAYYTLTMIIDPGSIAYVVKDVGTAGVIVSIFSLVVIIVGMITFTGAVIGYVTNWISNFVEEANAGDKKLFISNHIVILNWNTRGIEIVRELMYAKIKEKIVILVEEGKEEIEKEIQELVNENKKRKLTFVVREGEVFSSKQLKDVSIEKAKSILIMDDALNKEENVVNNSSKQKGNMHTVKTLMQVITLTSEVDDIVKIIVEINEKWTDLVVGKIIQNNENTNIHIYRIRAFMIIGQLLSQFSLMPQLNVVYQELFSNEDGAFYCKEQDEEDEFEYIRGYLENHNDAIPLTFMKTRYGEYGYYSATSVSDIDKLSSKETNKVKVKLRSKYRMKTKNVIILGHNSKCEDILRGFDSFCGEWDVNEKKILNVTIIDSDKNIKLHNYAKDYQFITKVVAADIYDRELICDEIEAIINTQGEDVNILILSDDKASSTDMDANVFSSLVYLKDVIDKKKEDDDFDGSNINIITEIINTKHHEIANGYSSNNVVISDKYISKMVAQIIEKEALFDFYQDILTYDADDEPDSKEIYIKYVCELLEELPPICTYKELIEAVFDASVELDINNPMMVLGYVKGDEEVIVFSGDLSSQKIELKENDALIIFSEY